MQSSTKTANEHPLFRLYSCNRASNVYVGAFLANFNSLLFSLFQKLIFNVAIH